MSDSQQRYREFEAAHTALPIFMQPWWLDAAAGPGNWDAAVCENESGVRGVLPYTVRRARLGMVLGMPQLTQALGPWVSIPEGAKHYRRLSIEKEVMFQLIDSLPEHAKYGQSWRPELTNWQPFYWRGFKQTTRYTYTLPVQESVDDAWSTAESKTRKNIRRAQDTHRVECREEKETAILWPLIGETFRRQRKVVPFDRSVLERVQSAAFDRSQGINITGYVDGEPVTSAFFVWDHYKLYYLVSGSRRDSRNTHALSLILWRAIELATSKRLVFDFEGSMLENVEQHFRSFGAIQTPYFQVWRYGSRRHRLLEMARRGLRLKMSS